MDLYRACGRAFAVSVASWAMALEGLEEAVDLLGRDHRPGVRDGDDGLVALDPVEISNLPPGTL